MQKLGLFRAATVGELAYECAELPASSIEVVTFAPERNRSRPFATVARVEKKRFVVALVLGKKWSPICAVPIASMSLPCGRSRLLGRQDTKRLNQSIGKSVPIVRWTASAIFNAPEGGKVDGPQRSSGFANRNWIQGDDLNRTLSIRGRRGIKWRWWSKVFTTWDAGVSDRGRLLT